MDGRAPAIQTLESEEWLRQSAALKGPNRTARGANPGKTMVRQALFNPFRVVME
jgi:hypothetical protein